MRKARVLVVDDEPGMLEVCRDSLITLGEIEVHTEDQAARAATKLADASWDLVIADIRMPGLTGVDLLDIAHHRTPDLPFLMLTAYPTVDTAVECMKLGAIDYVVKPFLPDDLRAMVRRILDGRRAQEAARARRVDAATSMFGEMVGRSAPMLAIYEAIERVAGNDVDVLILGETGTGKELVARSIHQGSRRSEARLVPVDCGAIPEDLLESEFFGHEKGAFTGAESRHLGLLEFAAHGTLFLDEVDHLPPKLQAKLLRALQERRIRRVGGTQEFDIDIRVIAASSLDIDDAVRKQQFRSDLYYRINVARIELPPLRRRPEDIALLARHFLTRYAREMQRGPAGFEQEALEVLSAYAWPGNVRELQNVIKRVLAFTRSEMIRVEDLPDAVVAAAGNLQERNRQGFFAQRERHVAAFEREYFRDLLRAHAGDFATAAAEARIPRGTLYRLAKKHDLNPADFRS